MINSNKLVRRAGLKIISIQILEKAEGNFKMGKSIDQDDNWKTGCLSREAVTGD